MDMGDNATFAQSDLCMPTRAEARHDKVAAENACTILFQCAYQDHFTDRNSGARLIEAADKNVEFDPKALARAAKDLANGTWSKETRDYFKKIFDEANKDPKATAASVKDTLHALGVAINNQADKDGIATNINLAGVRSEDGTRTSFWFVMNGPNVDLGKETQEVMSGKGGPSTAKVGEFVEKPRRLALA